MRLVSLIFLAIIFSQHSSADADADIKYRQGVMSAVGGHMKAMGTILKAQVHESDLAFHAEAMANISRLVPRLFPEGSGAGKTEALPEIWQEPLDFDAKLVKFTDAAKEIDIAVKSGDMSLIAPAIKALGGSCKGCHDEYKKD